MSKPIENDIIKPIAESRKWIKPTVKRVEAGSAEAGGSAAIDGGVGRS